MAKKKTTTDDTVATKTMGLFDHVSNIKTKKLLWKDMTDGDRKTWSTYMVNRIVSMNENYTDLVNQLQKYTMGILDSRETQRLYCEILPYDRSFSKYIKGKNEDKYDKELVNIIRSHYYYSSQEAEEYLDIILPINPNEIIALLKKYGKTVKEIEKMLK